MHSVRKHQPSSRSTLPCELVGGELPMSRDEERGLLEALAALRADDDHCSAEVRAALDDLLRD